MYFLTDPGPMVDLPCLSLRYYKVLLRLEGCGWGYHHKIAIFYQRLLMSILTLMLICVSDDTSIDVDVDEGENINVDFVAGVSIVDYV